MYDTKTRIHGRKVLEGKYQNKEIKNFYKDIKTCKKSKEGRKVISKNYLKQIKKSKDKQNEGRLKWERRSYIYHPKTKSKKMKNEENGIVIENLKYRGKMVVNN